MLKSRLGQYVGWIYEYEVMQEKKLLGIWSMQVRNNESERGQVHKLSQLK